MLPRKADGAVQVSLGHGKSQRVAAAGAVVDWLRSEGLTVASTTELGTVAVSGTVADIDRAFATSLQVWPDPVSPRATTIAPSDSLTVPARFADDVAGVAGLVKGAVYQPATSGSREGSGHTDPTDAPTPQPAGRSRVAPKVVTASTECSRYWGENIASQWPTSVKVSQRSNWICGYTPADLRAMHRIPADYTGEGARIGIIAAYDDPAVEANTNHYFAAVGEQPLRPGQYVRHTPANPDETICGGSADWSIEQNLDIQAAHAIAPDAVIEYWGTDDCTSVSMFTAMYDAVSAGEIDVLSLSFGSREEMDTAADRELLNRALVQAASTGISVFAASGNDGDYSDEGDRVEVDVTSPASSPYVTAVGGLSVGMRRDGALPVVAGWATKPHFARNGGVIPPGFDSGSGGGISAQYSRPTWQQTPAVDANRRLVPDIASLGDPTSGFTVYSGSGADAQYRSVGGTSLATPIVASMVAISKQRTGANFGLATPWLYALQGTPAIRDVIPTNAAVWSSKPVTTGQTWPETVYAWDASPQSLKTAAGWDPISGIGMPTGAAFFDNLGQ